jgi:septin family protein
MTAQDILTKAHERKTSAELQHIKARLDELRARATVTTSRTEIDAIHYLTAKRQEIETKHHELTTATEAKEQQLEAELDEEMARLKSAVEQVAAKLKKTS